LTPILENLHTVRPAICEIRCEELVKILQNAMHRSNSTQDAAGCTAYLSPMMLDATQEGACLQAASLTMPAHGLVQLIIYAHQGSVSHRALQAPQAGQR